MSAPLLAPLLGVKVAVEVAVEVAVDRETGSVRVLSAVAVVDVGQVINPVLLRGQLEGGFVYGLGMALTEDLFLEDGRTIEVES